MVHEDVVYDEDVLGGNRTAIGMPVVPPDGMAGLTAPDPGGEPAGTDRRVRPAANPGLPWIVPCAGETDARGLASGP